MKTSIQLYLDRLQWSYKIAKLKECFTKTEWSLELNQPEKGVSDLGEAV